MKVTVFNGSPRGRKSNSHLIVEPLLEGAREAGAQTEEIFLIEHDIKYCRGCFVCWGKTPGTCAIKDDMTGLLNLFLESDYAGMATPVYNMYMTGLLKNFTDRFLPLAMPHIKKNEDGTFYHEGRVKKLPRQFFIANAGFPGAHNFDLLKPLISMQNFVLEVYRNCGEALQDLDDSDSELSRNIRQYFDTLRSAGREMVASGKVSEETLKQLDMELISDDEYMKGGNQYWDEKLDE